MVLDKRRPGPLSSFGQSLSALTLAYQTYNFDEAHRALPLRRRYAGIVQNGALDLAHQRRPFAFKRNLPSSQNRA